MRRALLAPAVLVAAVVFFLLATLPPAPMRAEWGGDPSLVARTVAGAYHVHSNRSDGTAGRAEVAQAASQAGLQFVIFTDHGNATVDPEPPAYLSGVLCVDGVEISTNGGHYAALGLPRAPYPLGGEPFAVIEDVARLGGFGFATHVDSPKADLAWTDWDVAFDGIEWMNADSEWRDEPRGRLMRTLFDYFGRPGPALASLLDRPAATLARWDALTDRRPVVALAGHDAHGGIGRGVEDAGRRGLPMPSYEASFRSFSTRVILDAPLSKDAASDARRLLAAIRAGRVFTAIDSLALPSYIDVRASYGDGREAQMGAVLPVSSGAISVHASMPPGAEIALIHRGKDINVTRAGHATYGLERFNGAVRVEVRVPGAPGDPPIPWVVTNPIYFLPSDTPQTNTDEHLPNEITAFPPDIGWHVEHDPTSRGSLGVSPGSAGGQPGVSPGSARGQPGVSPRSAGGQPGVSRGSVQSQPGVSPGSDRAVTLDYRLGPPPTASQFVALAADMPGRVPVFERLMFDARASRPMRVSVQLRYQVNDKELRWGRSIYTDAEARTVAVPLRHLLPMDGQTGPPPDPTTARSVLFVIDLTNAAPGTSGRFELSGLRFLR